jgi:hypothetical protein
VARRRSLDGRAHAALHDALEDEAADAREPSATEWCPDAEDVDQ